MVLKAFLVFVCMLENKLNIIMVMFVIIKFGMIL